MQKFFFDMIDGVPFRDRIGIEFKTNADAIAHCGVLARHFLRIPINSPGYSDPISPKIPR
jgi:hypothetical protein